MIPTKGPEPLSNIAVGHTNFDVTIRQSVVSDRKLPCALHIRHKTVYDGEVKVCLLPQQLRVLLYCLTAVPDSDSGPWALPSDRSGTESFIQTVPLSHRDFTLHPSHIRVDKKQFHPTPTPSSYYPPPPLHPHIGNPEMDQHYMNLAPRTTATTILLPRNPGCIHPNGAKRGFATRLEMRAPAASVAYPVC